MSESDAGAAVSRLPAKVSQQEVSNSVIMKCVTQLELIQTIEWILMSSTRPETVEARSPKSVPPPETDLK